MSFADSKNMIYVKNIRVEISIESSFDLRRERNSLIVFDQAVRRDETSHREIEKRRKIEKKPRSDIYFS